MTTGRSGTLSNVTPKERTMRRSVASHSALLNVAIIPSPPVSKAVSCISAELAKRGGIYEVDGIRRIPHITLYMARIEKEKFDVLATKFRELAGALPAVPVRHVGYHLTDGLYYEVSYRRDELVPMHLEATESMYTFRYSPGDPVKEEYFGPYSEA